MRHFFFLFFLLFVLNALQVTAQQRDTVLPELHTLLRKESAVDKLVANKAYRMLRIPVPVFVASAITYSKGNQFRTMRNTYVPGFHSHYDDYLQYLPAVAMIGMKLGGVKGRSSWGRMLVSDAFAVGLMALTVNGLKSSIDRIRPDGSGHNSFPSGHTATAFMTATMMHHEYGLTRSPLYSIGAYSVATATALSRQLNNKHWLSDVLAGAGIGILSTELGYYLADLIFKEKGRQMMHRKLDKAPVNGHPSFLEFGMGYSILNGSVELGKIIRISSPGATHVSAKGAYFFTRHLGLGGEVAALASSQIFDAELYEANSSTHNYHITGVRPDQMAVFTVAAGPYLSQQITSHFLLGSKLLAGYGYCSTNRVTADMDSRNPMDEPIRDIELLHGKANHNIFIRTGISTTAIISRNLALRLYLDYDYSFLKAQYNVLETAELPAIRYTADQYSKHHIQYFTIGAAITALFW